MNSSFVIATFVVVALFAYFFTEEFYAISDRIDYAYCFIGMEQHCK